MSAQNSKLTPNVVECRVDGTSSLTSDLISTLTKTVDAAEDAGASAVLMLRIGESRPMTAASPWPGAVGVHLVSQWERLLRRLERLEATSVAVLQGRCSLLAMELLLVADHRLATQDCTVELRDSQGEVWPGMLLHRLVRHLGIALTRRLLLGDGPMSAHRGVELALIEQVIVDFGLTNAKIVEYLKLDRLRDWPVHRRLLLDTAAMTFDDALGLHLAACDRTLRHTSAATKSDAVPSGSLRSSPEPAG